MGNAFGVNYQEPKIVSADSATLAVGGSIGLATGVQIQYGRQVSPIPTLGKGVHYAVGTPGGTMSVETMVTEDSSFADALGAGKKCQLGKDIVITLGSGCDTMQEVRYTLKGVICSAINVTARAGTGYVIEGLQVNFVAMDKS